MSDLVEDAIRILFESSFMTLATSEAAGAPWASPVEYECAREYRSRLG